MPKTHAVILVNNEVSTKKLVKELYSGHHEDFLWLKSKKVGEFSKAQIERFIEEEERHDKKILTRNLEQSLKSMSSGERKKALLNYLVNDNLEVLLVINPFDSLDNETQEHLKTEFEKLSERLCFIQITSRISDTLPFVNKFYLFQENKFQSFTSQVKLSFAAQAKGETQIKEVPKPLKPTIITDIDLVVCKEVSVNFENKPVLNNITWSIKKGEFWQLMGPNGSGKSTLLNLITGDSHKGYGQNLTVFGHKKGSGESVWDLKERIGYFSPGMVDRFKGYHTLEHMLISGIHDSVGLYVNPTEIERQKAREWLQFLGMENNGQTYFHELSVGAKRLLMTARAMIKHPPLLILDEPTVGLDDNATSLFIQLVNEYAKKSPSAIIYVSHRKEPKLQPQKYFELRPSNQGSHGLVNST